MNDIDKLKQYKIGILAGGPSSEREISLKSGRTVQGALEGAGFDPVFIEVNEDPFMRVVEEAGIDVVFIALHGRFGEDGTVQRMLEDEGVPYTGSGPEASHLALDKLASKKLFEEKGLNIPGYKVAKRDHPVPVEAAVPCVVKPRFEGSSVGLSVVEKKSLLDEAVSIAAEFDEDIIIEEFIPGREITVGVLDGKALPVVEILPAEGIYDFEAKYHSRDTKYVVPAELESEAYLKAQDAGLKAHNVLGCEDFSRVDMRLSEDGKVYVLEVNTIPGLTERSLLPMAAGAAGVDFLGLCVKMLLGALARKES
ncbi:MAG: D-alanine--D-alanine ligase [Candidatus Tantalella remota]|nr:D-alanine--D-alanine ligase [Candidatus Tantalella remota]